MAALSHGECDLAGFHVPIGEFEVPAAQRYRRWLRDDTHVLVHLAVRTQGLFVAPGNPKFVRGFADLRRKDLRFVNRPEGSGTRMLTELLLAKQRISPDEVTGYDSAEFHPRRGGGLHRQRHGRCRHGGADGPRSASACTSSPSCASATSWR